MKKLILSLMVSISCASAMDAMYPDLANSCMQPSIRSITEAEYADFQKSIITRELPTDVFETMNLVYPIVAQYYTDQAISLSAYLSTLNEQASTAVDKTDTEFNAIQVEKTTQLIKKYRDRANYLIQRPASIRELYDFITAAYAINSGLSSHEIVFNVNTFGYHTHSELFSDAREENRRHINAAYNFETTAKKLNTEIQEKFSTLISALSADMNTSFLHTFLASYYDPLFQNVEHDRSLKTYIKSSGDTESIIEEFTDRGMSVELTSQIDRHMLLLNMKKKVIKTERKIKFNEKMRALKCRDGKSAHMF